MSSLPKIDYPVHRVNIPSLKKEFQFRPFLVKEEKLLLMAKESEQATDILSAIKQIINNCSIDSKFDIDKLALFDLEYIFLKLRSISVDNIVKVSYKDSEDGKTYDFDIDLNKIEVKFPEKIINNIKITENSGIVMKYPSAKLYDDKEFLSLEKDYIFELIVRCIDSIYYEDQIYKANDYKKQDLVDFLENLNIKVFEEIQKFLLNIPKIEYVIKYENTSGTKREIVLNSLNDFFTWR
jgi:hypothetical protein